MPSRSLAVFRGDPGEELFGKGLGKAASSLNALQLCLVFQAAFRWKRGNLPDSEEAPSVYVQKKHILALRKTDRI